MRRFIVVAALLVSIPAALACEDDVVSVPPTPTPFGERVPATVAELPEGTLVVQDENPIGYPRLFAVGREGSEQIGKGPTISVSPDGGTLAAIEWGADNYRWCIRLLTANGDERAVIELPRARAAINSGMPYLLWSPNGDRLAYARASASDKYDIYTVNADGSVQRRLTGEPDYYSTVGWTADGSLLVWAPGRLSLTGAADRQLPVPGGIPNMNFTLSPDGRRVAIQADDYEREIHELWVLEIETLELRLAAHTWAGVRRPANGLYVSALPPAPPRTKGAHLRLKGPAPVLWSPDSTRIAYDRIYAETSAQLSSELRMIDLRSGEDVTISKEGFQPSWSPDGRYLAAPTGAGIVIHEDGENRTLETPARQAIWSSLGALLAIAAGGINIVDPETGATRSAVTDDQKPAYGGLAAYGSWVWSPSGRYLAFSTTSDQYTKGSVYILDTKSGTAGLLIDQQAFLPAGWLASD